ncbi:hypothetical protein H340_03614, partial [Streptomyces mobaraensis NBRC 13819 = DSM 40847]
MRGWLRAGRLTALAALAVFGLAGEAAADDLEADATAGNSSLHAVVHHVPRLLPPHPPSHVRVRALGGAVRANVDDDGVRCLAVGAGVLRVTAHVRLGCQAQPPPAATAPAAPAPAAPAAPAPAAPAAPPAAAPPAA